MKGLITSIFNYCASKFTTSDPEPEMTQEERERFRRNCDLSMHWDEVNAFLIEHGDSVPPDLERQIDVLLDAIQETSLLDPTPGELAWNQVQPLLLLGHEHRVARPEVERLWKQVDSTYVQLSKNTDANVDPLTDGVESVRVLIVGRSFKEAKDELETFAPKVFQERDRVQKLASEREAYQRDLEKSKLLTDLVLDHVDARLEVKGVIRLGYDKAAQLAEGKDYPAASEELRIIAEAATVERNRIHDAADDRLRYASELKLQEQLDKFMRGTYAAECGESYKIEYQKYHDLAQDFAKDKNYVEALRAVENLQKLTSNEELRCIPIKEARREFAEAVKDYRKEVADIQNLTGCRETFGEDTTKVLALEETLPLDAEGIMQSTSSLRNQITPLIEAEKLYCERFANAEKTKSLLIEVEKTFQRVAPVARTAVKAKLEKAWREAEKEATPATPERDLKKALKLLEALRKLLGEVEIENAKAEGTKGKLGKAAIGNTPLASTLVDELYDQLGPDALDGLESALGNLSQVATLADKVGVGELAKAFSSPADIANLKDLVAVEKSGLNVAALQRILEMGVNPNEDLQKQKAVRVTNLQSVRGLGKEFSGVQGMADLKALQQTGLGSPDILGAVLRDGCGGDAKVLKGLHKEFAGNLPGLQNMLTTACGANTGKLTDLMRITCEGDPKLLKQLHDAFANDPNDMVKLKTLSDELGNDSAVKLDRLWANPRLGGKATGLKYFYDSLDEFATSPNQRAKLIEVGGNVEFRKIDGEGMIGAAQTTLGKNARVGHVCGRHMMSCTNLAKPSPPAESTTFWPEGTDETDLTRYLDEAIQNVNASIPTRKGFHQLFATVGNNIRVTIGFEVSEGKPRVTQFYPKSQASLKSLSNEELAKLNKLLK